MDNGIIRQVLIGTILFVLVSESYAKPAMKCLPVIVIVKTLKAKYGETVQREHELSSISTMKLFANLRTGSWTIVMFRQSIKGPLACILSAGRGKLKVQL